MSPFNKFYILYTFTMLLKLVFYKSMLYFLFSNSVQRPKWKCVPSYSVTSKCLVCYYSPWESSAEIHQDFSLEKITGIFPSISAPSVCSGSGVTSDWLGEQHNFQIRSFECILAAGLLAEWWNPAVWLPELFQETQTDLGPRPKSLQ